MTQLPIYKVVFDENSEMIVNSIVDEPAHRHYFVAQVEKHMKFSLDDEKHEITGVVIAANQPIYYWSKDIPECFIVFDGPTIRAIALDYFKKNRFNKIDFMHDFNITDNDVVMLQSYFADSDQNQFGVEKGSWIMTYKVLNDKIWQEIKDGKFKGFSIAGNFNLKPITLTKKPYIMNIVEKIKALITQEEAQLQLIDVQTIDGKTMRVSQDGVKEGSKLYAIANDGTEVLAPQGDYVLIVDGQQLKVSVNELGVIVAVVPVDNTATDQTQQEMSEIKQRIADLEASIELIAKKLAEKPANFRKPEVKDEKREIKFKVN